MSNYESFEMDSVAFEILFYIFDSFTFNQSINQSTIPSRE